MPVTYYGEDVYGMGMGETGQADLFRINSNFSNPSLLVSTNKVLFTTASQFGYVWYQDAQNEFRNDGIYLPYFKIAIPLAKHRLGFSFNSTASGNLETVEEKTFISTNSDTLHYKNINRLESSLSKVSLLYAFQNNILNFGIGANYYFGHKTSFFFLDYDNSVTEPTAEFSDTRYEIDQTFKKPNFTIGISKKIKSLAFALSYSNAVDLEGETTYKYDHFPGSEDIEFNQDLFSYPAITASGFSFKFAEKYKVSIDLNYFFWKDTEFADYNTYKLGIGFAYDPLSGYGKWFNEIPLRLGAYQEELPFKVNNAKVLEKALTAGFSIPLQSSDKKFDFAVKFLRRGDVDKHDYADESLMFSIGITGFDIFRKRLKKTEPRDIPEADEDYIQGL